MDLSAIHAQAAQVQRDLGVSFHRLRYNGQQLSVKPRIKELGLNTAYNQTGAIRDALQIWEAYLDPTVLSSSGITAETALADYTFGNWEISSDNGSTWQKVFIYEIPRKQSTRWIVKFARGIVDGNLVVTYTVGEGTFVTDPETGNPVEDVTSATFYAIVSQGRNRAQVEESAGLSPARIYLEGYFATATGEPATMPSDLQLQRKWPAVLTVGNDLTVEGTFLPLVVTEDPWGAREDRRGSTIQGYFATVGTGR